MRRQDVAAVLLQRPETAAVAGAGGLRVAGDGGRRGAGGRQQESGPGRGGDAGGGHRGRVGVPAHVGAAGWLRRGSAAGDAAVLRSRHRRRANDDHDRSGSAAPVAVVSEASVSVHATARLLVAGRVRLGVFRKCTSHAVHVRTRPPGRTRETHYVGARQAHWSVRRVVSRPRRRREGG